MSNNDADLVLHLTLDELRDGKFLDASGRGYDGVVQGNVTLVPDDVFGACASFPGDANSFIAVPDNDDLRIVGDLTLEAWVYLAGAPADWVRVIGKGPFDIRNYGLWYSTAGWLFQRHSGSECQNCQTTALGAPRRPEFQHRQIPTLGESWQSEFRNSRIPAPGAPWQLNTWYHMAAVLQGGSASLYIHDVQGREVLAQPEQSSWAGASAITADALTIGYAGFHGGHNGRIAAVRVYKRALSGAEIERDIRRDCMDLVAFRKSHPIDFRLYDDDEQAVLYISDDSIGRNLNLALHNTSTQTIQLSDGQSAPASADNHHFAVRFRPGTLSDRTLKALINPQERATLLKQADQWDLYFPPTPPAANETAALYLLYTGPATSFQPDESRALTLQGMSAAPGSGARGTQVELVPRQLTTANGDATPITGVRTQYVHITNQSGRKNIPLHVGFVGGNAVLNVRRLSNALRLRITNASKNGEIKLTPNTDRMPSRFIISFDTQPEGQIREWALVTSGDSQSVKVSVNGREIPPVGIEGETPEWPIAFDAAFSLAAGKPLQIDLTGIVSSLPSGHANLYVRYENIPGYWDGQFVCTVEKTPLLIAGENVGIGVANPAAPLHVNGRMETDANFKLLVDAADYPFPSLNRTVLALEPKYHADANRSRVFLYAPNNYHDNEPAITLAANYGPGAFVGIGTTTPIARLEVAGDAVAERLSVARANDRRGGLFFATAGDFNHVVYNNISNLDGEGSWDGAKWNVTAGLNIRVGAGNAKKSALMIDGAGNVGVGATSPQAKLQVLHVNQDANGNALVLGPMAQSNLRLGYHQDYSWVQSHGLKPLAINPLGNNVGIGTTTPITALQVVGDVLVTGRMYCAGGVAVYNGSPMWAFPGAQANGWSLNNTGAGGQPAWGPSHSVGAPGGWEWTAVPRSDSRLKKDVRPLPQALEKVLRLRGVAFKWNDAGLDRLTQFIDSYDAGPGATKEEHVRLQAIKRAEAREKLSRPELGLIAQEVRDVAPELVSEDEEGYLGVAYERTVALLIEAIKEQQTMIQTLSDRITAMSDRPPPEGPRT